MLDPTLNIHAPSIEANAENKKEISKMLTIFRFSRMHTSFDSIQRNIVGNNGEFADSTLPPPEKFIPRKRTPSKPIPSIQNWKADETHQSLPYTDYDYAFLNLVEATSFCPDKRDSSNQEKDTLKN